MGNKITKWEVYRIFLKRHFRFRLRTIINFVARFVFVFHTAQKMKFSIKDFFSKCDQSAVSCGFGQFTEEILMENSSFVQCQL